ncbi:MAG: D-2-hydroxyacid dehydrogenase [Candidatus Limivivens sp.]|nr:D-2-hydroxyacid dehydrogenase [Candidatus Limivivens sp.]
MKIVFLEAGTLGSDMDFSAFERLGQVVRYEQSTAADTPEKVADADIVVVNKINMNARTLAGADRLKMIAITATGYNMIDLDYTRKQGIAVANVAGYSTDAVAQHTFALLFYVMHKLAYYDAYVKSGNYCSCDSFTHIQERFHELAGKNWGIIGMGAIGHKVARIAEAFGCRVLYHSMSGCTRPEPYEHVDLDTLLEESDILSIHAPLTPATEGMMNREAFRKMKPSAILLNLARGPIVNEADLVEALETGEIAAAGLDVLSVEPMRPENPLLAIQDSRKLIITPHVAWAPVETRARLLEEVYRNIEAFLKGEERNRIC